MTGDLGAGHELLAACYVRALVGALSYMLCVVYIPYMWPTQASLAI